MKRDLTGLRYGRLTVLREAEPDRSPQGKSRRRWVCRCDCGNITTVHQSALVSKTGTRSCGCLLSDTAKGKIEANVLGNVDGTRLSAIRPDRPANSNSRSGVKGVYWSEKEHCWHAKIGLRKKTIDLGLFLTMEAAEKARRLAEEKYYEPILEAHNDEPSCDSAGLETHGAQWRK